MGLRVLMVEDDRYQAMVIERALRAEIPDVEMTVAPGLSDAVRALDTRPFDLSLVNSTLPDASGLDVVRTAREISPDLPLVVITPRGSTDVGAAALKKGAADFVERGPEFEVELPKRAWQAYCTVKGDVRRRRFLELGERLSSSTGVDEVMKAAAGSITSLLDASAAMVWVSCEEGHWETATGLELPISDASAPASVLMPMVGDPGETSAVLYGPDRNGQKPLDRLAGAGISHVAVGGARAGEDTVVCLLAARVEGRWEDEELRWVAAACASTAKAAERAIEDMRERIGATTDAVTGLPNRRSFEQALRTESERAQRQRTPVSVAIFDIDGLKDYNEAQGRGGGDALLRAVGARLRRSLRRYDFAAQLGGGKFSVIFPAAALNQATGVAERLRKRLSGHDYPGTERVTVSCGVASYPECVERLADLIDVADQALLLSKRRGRARTTPAPQRQSGIIAFKKGRTEVSK